MIDFEWLQHPDIYKLSAWLSALNLVCVVGLIIFHGNLYWLAYNALFMVYNLIVTWINYNLRDTRRAAIAKKTAMRRHLLIEKTVGT